MQRYNVGFVESDPQIFFSFPFQPEGLSSVKLGKLIECESDEKDEKPKTKKKKSKKEGSASEEEKEEEPIEEVNTDHPHKPDLTIQIKLDLHITHKTYLLTQTKILITFVVISLVCFREKRLKSQFHLNLNLKQRHMIINQPKKSSEKSRRLYKLGG